MPTLSDSAARRPPGPSARADHSSIPRFGTPPDQPPTGPASSGSSRQFTAAAGEYTGHWFDEGFAKPANGKDGDDALRAERIWDQAKAEAIRTKCVGKPGDVTEESKPSTQLSPLLFDLTSLQRDANKRFGFSAKNTLAIAQALYEKHKVLTYPRTDSRAAEPGRRRWAFLRRLPLRCP